MSKLPYSTFLIIEWHDATSNDGWTSPDADVDVEHIVSAGWLIKETEIYVTIAGSIYRNSPSTIGSTMTIPKGMIVSRKEVKISNARSKLRHKLHPEPSAKEIHREPGESGPVLKPNGRG